jgi:pseudaminic acid synthase
MDFTHNLESMKENKMFNQTFEINGQKIGKGCEPYIIAEMSANHGNDINKAIEIIKEAKKAGADAIKIQTYTADTLTLDCKKPHFEAKGAWSGQYLYDLYLDASMPWEWTPKLQEVAMEFGITLFSTPFDFSSVDFLESLHMPAYKIASPEIVDLPLVRRIAQTKKPIILSTGNATLGQINDAVAVMIEEGVKDLAILKCTSEYPAPVENIDLKTIQHLKKTFKCPVGLSDHTLGSAVPIGAVALGASIIEKHFIVNRTDTTADSFFSATPEELKAIVDGSKMVYKAIGKVNYPIVPKKDQRSLIAIKDIEIGEIFSIHNIKSLRPGGGIASKNIESVLQRKATATIERGTLLQWEMIGELS